jgi:hypothetical protein
MENQRAEMSKNTYVVDEKLAVQSYSVKTNSWQMGNQIETANKAGVKFQFYAYIPQRKKRDENLLKQKFEIDESQPDKPKPQKFTEKLLTIDGIYLLSNLESFDGRLKSIEQRDDNTGGAIRMKELDEDWEIYIDPVTADVLGIKSGEMREKAGELPSVLPDEILERIDEARHKVRLTFSEIQYRTRHKSKNPPRKR